MVQRSIITLALLHEFVYEFRGNNTYIILDRTALSLQRVAILTFVGAPIHTNLLVVLALHPALASSSDRRGDY